MNDNFLHQLRVAPPARFLGELKVKLDRQGLAPRRIRQIALRTLAIIFLGGTGVAAALIIGGGLRLPWISQLRAVGSPALSQPSNLAKELVSIPSPPSPSPSSTNSSRSAINAGQPQRVIGEGASAASAPASPSAQDDWDFATQLLPAAKAGNRDAQYRLFAVIDDCQTLLDYYFTQEGTPLTLVQGMEKASNATQKQQAQEGFVHCHRFSDHNAALELGSADYWLEKASQSGHPLAQAVTARRILDADARDAAVPLLGNGPAGMSFSIPSGAPPERRAVDLLRAAVKSLNPGVLEIIGNEQTELHGSRTGETVDRFAWIYVACQRGLNCTGTSHLATDYPTDCDVSTPEGTIMAWSHEDWPAVQLRARDINAKLDAGKWNELGLSP